MWALLFSLAFGAETPAAATQPSPTDVNHAFVSGYAGIALNPIGAIAEGTVELRTPVMRYGGLAFNDTFIGAGLRAVVTPVNADVAARVTFQPIDLLPITVEGFWGNYWESPWGPVPADRVENMQRRSDRQELYDADKDFSATTMGINLKPKFQAKYKKVAAFSSWTFTFMKAGPRQASAPWWFDSYRGMVLGYEDRVIEHTSALLWEFKDGEDGTSLLRAGPMVRGKWAKNTTDETLAVGGVLMWRPGKQPTAPTALLMVTPYVKDPDFSAGIPYVALLFSSKRALPFQKQR